MAHRTASGTALTDAGRAKLPEAPTAPLNSPPNANALRKKFSEYVAARKDSGRQNRASDDTTAKRGNADELAKIRKWLNANGHEVSSRGRISQAVRDAYDAAQ